MKTQIIKEIRGINRRAEIWEGSNEVALHLFSNGKLRRQIHKEKTTKTFLSFRSIGFNWVV